jgi:hypothetical protein
MGAHGGTHALVVVVVQDVKRLFIINHNLDDGLRLVGCDVVIFKHVRDKPDGLAQFLQAPSVDGVPP